jgi:hypothetical protein
MKISINVFIICTFLTTLFVFPESEDGYFDPTNQDHVNLFKESWDENENIRNGFSSSWIDFWRKPTNNDFMQNTWSEINTIKKQEDFNDFLLNMKYNKNFKRELHYFSHRLIAGLYMEKFKKTFYAKWILNFKTENIKSGWNLLSKILPKTSNSKEKKMFENVISIVPTCYQCIKDEYIDGKYLSQTNTEDYYTNLEASRFVDSSIAKLNLDIMVYGNDIINTEDEIKKIANILLKFTYMSYEKFYGIKEIQLDTKEIYEKISRFIKIRKKLIDNFLNSGKFQFKALKIAFEENNIPLSYKTTQHKILNLYNEINYFF